MDDQILMIEISGQSRAIPFASFLKIAEHTLSLLKGMDGILHGGDDMTWTIERSTMNSPLTLSISASGPEATAGRIEAAIIYSIEGLQLLDKDASSVPPYYDEKLLGHAKDIVSPLNDGIAELVYTSGSLAVRPTLRVAANVAELTKEYQLPGVVDGLLQRVNAHSELTFSIFDVLTGNRTNCRFGPDLRDKIKDALYARVRVKGTVHYSRSGRPVLIDAEDIVAFPPEPTRLFRIPPVDVTGGIDPANYVERLRRDG